MKRLFLILMLFVPGLSLAQFPYGHGNYIITVTDTVNIDKTSNYFYYYSTEGKLYFSKGGHLAQVAAGGTGTVSGLLVPNNTWIRWYSSTGTPINVMKLSNGNAITLNSAAVYLLPDVTGTMFLGSETLGWRGVYVEGKKLNDDLAIFTNEADGAEGDSTSKINSKAQFVSGVPVGVAPFVVTSTTVNTNLNADLLDGVSIAGIVRTAECWVYYEGQNPSLCTLPVDAKVLSVECWVDTGDEFNSDGTDVITVGYDADPDAYATDIDVSSAGVKTVTLGATAKTVDATSRAVECYYVNGGTEPSDGFAHISITWIQATTKPAP